MQSIGTLMNVFKFWISKLLRLMDINKQVRITKKGIVIMPFGQIIIIENVWEEMERNMCGYKFSQSDYIKFF